MTNEERDLLNRMNTGAYDGVVGSIRATKFGYAVWNEIKDGIAFRYRQRIGGVPSKDNPNKLCQDSLYVEEFWDRDERRLEFLRNNGAFINDSAVKAYSAKYHDKI